MEQARLKELFRYFRAASNAASLAYEDIDSPINYRPNEAPLSTDIVVNALIQLVVHRLDCDRAFVSLIDDEFQFVIAEATRSISLVDAAIHDQDDGICIGTRPLALDAGICAATMPAFTEHTATDAPSIRTANIYADCSRYVINDLAAEDKYKLRPYVRGYPNMRWYAEVPLRTATGYAIGSLAMVDAVPRSGLQKDEYRIMFETASAIMRHLEMLRISAEHSQAVNLLNGLDKFMHQRPSLPMTSRQEHLALTSVDIVEGMSKTQPLSLTAAISATESSSARNIQSPHKVETLIIPERAATSPSADIDSAKGITPECSLSTAIHPPIDVNNRSDYVETSSTHQEARISIFESAASLLREAAHLDGVVFFNVAPAASSYDPASPVVSASLTSEYSSVSNVGVQDDPLHNDDSRRARKQYCKRFGSAFRDVATVSAAEFPASKLLLPFDVMQSLLYHFPKGTIFNPEHLRNNNTTPSSTSDGHPGVILQEQTPGASSSTRTDLLERSNAERELRFSLPTARSIVFHPLWNSQTENWYAACLAWSNDSRRVLQSSELSYITAFSNSIMAEIVNLELLAIDNAKSDFISSISHEVRSPLHGILGSTEILADVVVDKEQKELVQVVENCGRNLLETMDNILHFSKINSKARTVAKPKSQHSDPSQRARRYEASVDESEFDISKLVEESVESLIVSHQHSSSLSTTIFDQSNVTTDRGNGALNFATEGRVVVTLRIGRAKSWMVKSRTAVWQRILTNLLGNAMKYTPTGCIEIDLSATPQDENSGTFHVSLVIRDTGKGISQSYLDNRLYQPFVQEDTLSPGTGLGLSIVKGLVGEIQGEISIRSTKGVGTEATVHIPVIFLAENILEQPSVPGQRVCLLGFDTNFELDMTPTGQSPMHARRTLALKNALKSTCEERLKMKVSCTNHRSEVDSNIIVIMEEDVHLFKSPSSSPGLQSLDIPADTVLILLCIDHTMREKLTSHEKATGIYYLSQPFGPLQLTRVMTQIQTSSGQAGAVMRQHLNLPQHTSGGTITQVGFKSTTTVARASLDTGKLVLLVEDNSINLRLLVRSMQKIGRNFLTATDGRQAVEVYRAQHKEIEHVFMDISMPVMDGFTATRDIRAFENERGLPRVPITMLTGLGSAVAQEEAENSGSDRFWVKPVRLAMLKSLLNDP